LECDALVVGGGFAGVFMFWLLKNQGLDVIMYEAGDGYGGTWRWNCYRTTDEHDVQCHICSPIAAGAMVDSEVPEYQLSIPEVMKALVPPRNEQGE
jgi:monoamine oxidase